jgi:DNA-binding SARP family transcriptional activator/tetratricopeptide (TPR) repeat protein
MSGPGTLEILLLGPLEVRRDGAVVRIGGAKPRMLLADLALSVGVAVSVDRIIDDLWGERPPKSAEHGVEVHVSKLRTHVGEGVIVTRNPGYALEIDPDRIDITRFTELSARGRALVETDPQRAGALLREALALWRGPALDDFAFEPFAQIPIARVNELRQNCIEERVEADLASGRHAELVPELEALVRAEPLRERVRGQLMIALYRCGRAPDALASYRSGRNALLEELGMDPGPGLRALEAAILRQDESLLVPAPPAQPRARTERRLATIVCVELASDAVLDPEAAHGALTRWRRSASAVLERHEGAVVAGGADAFVAAFGLPVAREDDLLRAARAALDLTSLETQGFEVRVGLESGEIAVDGSLVAGQAVVVAKEATRTTEPGSVRVGVRAASLLAHAATFAEQTSQLLEVAQDAPPFERRLDAPLVGRERELRALRAAFETAVNDDACITVGLVGPAGIGKTRLALELAGGVRGSAAIVATSCTGGSYRALVPLVDGAAGGVDAAAILALTADETAAATLAAALGMGEGTPSPQEVAWSFRRLCDAAAASRPLLMVLDDFESAEPTLVELVRDLVERASGPMLVLCLSREHVPVPVVNRVELDGLTPEEVSTLVQRLQDRRALPAGVLVRVLDTAEGNPLFVEQLIAFAAEEGTAVERPLPPTIHALLATRLDRLGPGQRAVLARAAVAGREFRSDDVAALLDGDAAATGERHLRRLANAGFLNAADGRYRFRHGLVQEAAYRAVSKEERAGLHERYGDHLARLGESDELVGFHLERACALLEDLGVDERRLRQLAYDAGTRLGNAGILAWKRNDVSATVGLLERSLRRLPAKSSRTRELRCELGLALRARGDAQGSVELLSRAAEPAASAADAHLELRARIELAFVRLLEEQGASGDELLGLVEASIPTFEALNDNRGLGRAWLLASFVHSGMHLHCRAGEVAAEHALDHYSRAAWPLATCLGQLASSLYKGPAPAATAAARCEAHLSAGQVGPAGQAQILAFLGGLVAMIGSPDEGRLLVRRARSLLEELGHIALGAVCGGIAASIDFDDGDLAAAETTLRETCTLLREAKLMSSFATRASELGAVLYACGQYTEAARWTSEAERATSGDDLDARLVWQPLRAKLHGIAGEHDVAVELASAAWALAEATDASNHRARVLADLAEVHRMGGRADEASLLVERARDEYREKGNLAGLGRLRSLAEV